MKKPVRMNHKLSPALIGVGLALSLCLVVSPVQANMVWTPEPTKRGHDRHAAKKFVLQDSGEAAIHLLTPQLETKALQIENGNVAVHSTGFSSYHALVAQRTSDGLEESAIRYVYMNGRPPGESPKTLMSYQKSDLEIEPTPYAREHWRFYTAKQETFILRFKGKPLASTTMSLETSNGSEYEWKTDELGRFPITFPEDFKPSPQGLQKRRASEMVITAVHQDQGISYITTLSVPYYRNPSHWQSLELGLVVGAVGMLLGGFVMFRKKRKGEK